MANAFDLLQLLRQAHILGGAELLTRLQQLRPSTSRATMMRLVREQGGQVVSRGAARRAAYAARRPLRGDSEPLPLYRIDQAGRGSEVASLDPILPTGCALRYQQAWSWPLSAPMRDGWFEGLPYPVADMRPQGFLGRNLARACAVQLRLPEDVRRWGEDDVLVGLAQLGADCPGDLILGASAYRRHLDAMQRGHAELADGDVERVYPELADAALTGEGAGTGAALGGECPKFTVCRAREGGPYHALVKFGGADDTPGVRRWADLLVCEHLALRAIATHLPLAASASRLYRAGGRQFLEVERYDRHGAHGRSPVCSWAALEPALFGMAGATWPAVAVRLSNENHISPATERDLVCLWHFGRLIANDDMHDGNLAFRPAGGHGGLTLAPAYDMLPMLYAPARGVELARPRFAPELPLPGERELWRRAALAAIHFWQTAAGEPAISPAFRAICAANGEQVARLMAQA